MSFTHCTNKKQKLWLYHYSNEGLASWYDFAKSIFNLSQTEFKAIPVRTAEYITKAVRPTYSVLDKTKIKKSLQIEFLTGTKAWPGAWRKFLGKTRKVSRTILS